MKVHVVADTIGGTADRASYMGPVAVAVATKLFGAAIADGVEDEIGTSAKLGVSDADSGVEDVGVDTAGIPGDGIGAIERQRALVDAIQPPGAYGISRHQLIGLDPGNSRVSLQSLEGLRRQARGKAGQHL